MPTKAYAAQSPTTPLAPFSIDRRAPGAKDVAIDILFCGVCHSDLHTARGEWPGILFPSVPGHEIVGRVTKVGATAYRRSRSATSSASAAWSTAAAPASPATTGWSNIASMASSAPITAMPFGGSENTYGGYSTDIVVDEHFVLKVNHKEKDLAAVAPLLCAGITTWSPLRHWKVGPGRRSASSASAGSAIWA